MQNRGPFWSAPIKIRKDSTDGGYYDFRDMNAVVGEWGPVAHCGEGEKA